MEHISQNLESRSEHIERYSLPEHNRVEWARTITSLTYPTETDTAAFRTFSALALSAAESHLTPDIRGALKRLSDPLTSLDVLVIDGLPHNAALLLPDSLIGLKKDEASSEAVLVGLARAAECELIGYKQEQCGALVHQVMPRAGQESTQSSAGSVHLDFHADDVFLPRQYRPEILALIGLINDEMIPTSLLLLADILPMMPTDLLSKLQDERFFFPAPYSFKFGDRAIIAGPYAIIDTLCPGVLGIALPDHGHSQPDPDAQRLLDAFQELLNIVQPRYITVGPGVFLGFRNSRLLHGRGAIKGRRWLQRIYCNRSLNSLRDRTSSDPFAQVFDAVALMDHAVTV